ncbi:amidase family protein [Govanella unica]|uniref:Amidase family protein n=1 Tax=Govanella unica TaxID=2975056 RepID=A0A9X3TXV5_9PROT|nr:amidase family protein [Govania unica]MDA5193720.1 amidase family protein [Govania unica]
MSDQTILDLTGVDAIAALKKGDLRLIDYVDALLGQSDRLRDLNAFVTQDPDRVRDAARKMTQLRGPLYGLPFVLKDNINTADLPTTACTPALQNWVPPMDAPITRSLRESGGLLLGKVAMHELAFGIRSNNRHYGSARNPYGADHMPGGSSSGTAIAVSARMAPLGIGTDTGGSCRIPAALCGCVGFRPTLDRYDARGIVPLSSTRDTPGPLARSVADIILMDEICAVKKTSPVVARSLKGVRLGVPRGYFYEDLHPATAKICAEALEQMREAGAVLIEKDIPHIGDLSAAVGFPIALFEAPREVANYLYVNNAPLSYQELARVISSDELRQLIAGLMGEGGITPETYRTAMLLHRPKLQDVYERYFRDNAVDALVVPTTPLPASLRSPDDRDDPVELNGRMVDSMTAYIRNTDPSSNAGLPALSVPAGVTDEGLPVGIEFVGPAYGDAMVLAIGQAYERLRPMIAPPALSRP